MFDPIFSILLTLDPTRQMSLCRQLACCLLLCLSPEVKVFSYLSKRAGVGGVGWGKGGAGIVRKICQAPCLRALMNHRGLNMR